MQIRLVRMKIGPSRDAELYYHADVEHLGDHYAIRIMTEGVLAASVRHQLGLEELAPVVAEVVYQQVITELVETGQLKPGVQLNWIYLVHEGKDADEGEVVVRDAEVRLLAEARGP